MASDDYVELAGELLDKMREFIGQSEPGETLIPLHKAYSTVRLVLDAADPDSDISRRKRQIEDAQRDLDDIRDRDRQRREQREGANAESSRARDGWKGLDRNVKMGRILNALGDGALVRREIVERIREAHPDISVYENDLPPLLNEMLATGELERQKEPRGPNCAITAKGGYRWRWRRSRAEMTPELQGLQRRLGEA